MNVASTPHRLLFHGVQLFIHEFTTGSFHFLYRSCLKKCRPSALAIYIRGQSRNFSDQALNTKCTPLKAELSDSVFVGENGETLDLNSKQLCKVSHRNFLLYAYNNLDMETVIKITNRVLAAYQTLPRKKTISQRRQYLQKFLKCIKTQKPQTDHEQLAKWFIRCIDLLTCYDLYSMLRVRHILNYDNSFETFRASFGMENFETFSNIQNSKELQDKLLEEKTLKNKAAQRNLLMRYLKINKFKFMRDQNITKAVYEANIEWIDEGVSKKQMDEGRFAFIYNLPFIELKDLEMALYDVLSRFGTILKIEILRDRLPPLTVLLNKSSITKKVAPPPKDKYSPLYALVEFERKEDRDTLCDTHIRVFGLICCSRIVYPELAERKSSLLTALYPPFRRMTDALQFIANTLVGNRSENLGDASQSSSIASQCKIIHSSKRKKSSQNPLIVVADKQSSPKSSGYCIPHQTLDNHVDHSMLENIKVKQSSSENLDPQWIVLRFENFKYAYHARQKLLEQLSDEPRSFVSFDTKRSIFYNGRYVDLPLFQYNQRSENEMTVTMTGAGTGIKQPINCKS